MLARRAEMTVDRRCTSSDDSNMLTAPLTPLGAYRTTNYNMLSLSLEFLKPLRGR